MIDLESALHTLADDGAGRPGRPDLAERALTRARQRSRHRAALAVLGAATAAVLVTVGMTGVVNRSEANHSAPAAGPSKTAASFAQPRMNLLLIGTDAASDRIGTRPDTIMLASIDTGTGDTTLLSLPRNLEHVPFPPGTRPAAAFPKGFACANHECLLNALWFWAEHDGAKYYPGDRHPGLTATTQAVEQLSGLTVDDTMVLNMQGLADLVDAVGGVQVSVHERLPIGGNASPGSPDYHKATGGYIEKGRQRLDGYHALWFARSRWSTDDNDRIGRQQCLIGALVTQIDPLKMVTSYPKIAKVLRRNLTTTIAADQLPDWAELAAKVKDATITREVLSSASGSGQNQVGKKKVAGPTC